MARKIKLVIDSITAFSDAPIKACSAIGAALLALGLLLFLVGLFSTGPFTLLLAVVIGLAGLQLLALGVVGEYVWRALDESRRRPAYLIEASTDQAELRSL
jgi:dolichol-phosphate mannosyltransferase